jgi:hypothetical protein
MCKPRLRVHHRRLAASQQLSCSLNLPIGHLALSTPRSGNASARLDSSKAAPAVGMEFIAGVPPPISASRGFRPWWACCSAEAFWDRMSLGFRRTVSSVHLAESPPSTDNIAPVTHSASGDDRNSTQLATSSGVPIRGQGIPCRTSSRHCSVSALVGRVIAVAMNPGQTTFTFMRWGPTPTAN